MTITTAELALCVERFLEYGADVRHFSPATIESYRRDLRQWYAWLCEQQPDAIHLDHALIGKYIYHRVCQQKIGLRSMNRALSALKSMITYLITVEGRAELQKLLLYISNARIAAKLPASISVEQIDQIIPKPTDFVTARDSVLIELLYSTGCRISELLSIDVEQVADGQRRVLIRGKGGREREVYIGERAAEAIHRYLSFRTAAARASAAASFDSHDEGGALFINRRAERLTRQGANVLLKKYQRILSLHKPLSAHVFRHSFATHILDSGADIRTVQELLGHQRLSSTQIYTHVSTAQMQRVYRQAHPHGRARRRPLSIREVRRD